MSRQHEVVGTTLPIDHIHMYSFSSGQSNSTCIPSAHISLGGSVFPSLPPLFCRSSFGFLMERNSKRAASHQDISPSPRKSSFQAVDRHGTSPGCIHYITQSHLDFWDQNDQPVGGWVTWRLLGTPKPLKNAPVSSRPFFLTTFYSRVLYP